MATKNGWFNWISFVAFLALLVAFALMIVDHEGWAVADPTPGEVWKQRDLWGRRDNPFREDPVETVRVVAVLNGWVQYVWRASQLECTIQAFKRLYHR